MTCRIRFTNVFSFSCLTLVTCILVSSCDAPLELPLISSMLAEKPNYVWSCDESESEFKEHSEAWYCEIADNSYCAVLDWHFNGFMGKFYENVLVFYSCQQSESSQCISLKHGLVVRIFAESGGDKLGPFGLFESKHLSAVNSNSSGMRIIYKGGIKGKAPLPFCESDTISWLHFDVKASQNREKVLSSLGRLYPILSEDPNTRSMDVVQSIGSLLHR